MTTSDIVLQIVIPAVGIVMAIVGIVVSVWFAASAKKDAERAQAVLDSIKAAVEGWQRQIMTASASILESTPQVIEGKTMLARVEAARLLSQGIQEAIHEIARNPQPGAAGHTQEQNLKTLTAQLNSMLEGMVKGRDFRGTTPGFSRDPKNA